MPMVIQTGRGRENQYDTEMVIAWMLDRARTGSQESAKERLDRVRGDREELKLAQEMDLLVLADDIERALSDAIAAANTELLFEYPESLVSAIREKQGLDVDIDLVRALLEPILLKLRARFDGNDVSDDLRDSDSNPALDAPDDASEYEESAE